MSAKRIGDFLVERKVLTRADVEQILEYGRRENLRFGEAGLELGLLSEEALIRVFGKNFRVDFFHLDPQYFPKQTSELLSIETILRYGVLPLGLKSEAGLFKHGKILNLGMLDPGHKEAMQAAEAEARVRADLSRVRIFLILADQFIDVVQLVYGMNPQKIADRPGEKLDRTLSLFLEERL